MKIPPPECRLLVLASHPIQYFTPIYRELARAPGLDLHVLFCRDFGVAPRFDEQFARTIQWDTDQLSGYSHEFLRNISPVSNTFNPLHAINPGAFTRVLAGADAVWVNGYVYPSNWFAAAAARLRGARLLFLSDMRLDRLRAPRPYDRVRDRIVRAWIRRSDALLYIGEANREAYRAYGAREDQLFFTPFGVDVDRLRAARLGAAERRERRRTRGIDPEAVVVLAVGKLIDRKHPEALLHLCERAHGRARIHVVFAGSGPLEEPLRADAARRGLSNVSFLGFVNQSELPDVYALADIFAMPSEREPWGLALNEAMAAGLAPVVSDEVGAGRDLVHQGETGFQFPSGHWDRFSDHVLRLASDRVLRTRIQRAALERSRDFSYAASARGVLHALRALRLLGPSTSRTPDARLLDRSASS